MTCDSIGSSYSNAAAECPSGAYFNSVQEQMQRVKNTHETRVQVVEKFALRGAANASVQLAVSKIFLYGTGGVKQSNDTALEYCKKAVELDPENVHAQKQLGQLLKVKGDHNGAEAAFRKYLARYPHDSYAHGRLGEILRLKGALQEAEMELAKADQGTSSYNQRAALTLKKEELFEARELAKASKGEIQYSKKAALELKKGALKEARLLALNAVACCDRDPHAKAILRDVNEKLQKATETAA